MKKLVVILFVMTASVLGCRHPDPLQLTPTAPDSTDQIQIVSLATSDTASLGDSMTVSTGDPEDNVHFGATVSVQRTINDYITFTTVRRIDTLDFASVIFLDWSRPVRDIGGHIYGYYGVPLASASLGVAGLLVRPHIVHLPLAGDTVVGVEYWRWLGGLYRAGLGFRWGFSVGGTDSTSASIQTPNDLVVHYPVGGATINRATSTTLIWTGSGDLSIIISEYFPLRKTAKPLLYIKPSINAGRLTLAPRVLQILPEDHRQYVFTFILSNRTEISAVSGYSAKVLVQAAVVYNSFVQLSEE